MDKIQRIKELTNLLNKASDAYYNSGYPIMGDDEFDALIHELKLLESTTGFIMSNSPTQNVGAEVKSKLDKVKHERPMLSLDKCHTVQELIDFAEDDDCYLSIKCDGLTTRLIYENGELVSAETRGDGETGQQVLFHVRQYVNVPTHISAEGKYVIDGESVIFISDFEIINNNLSEDEKFANSRNLASGTLSNLNSSITKQRSMRFIAWRVIEGDDTDSHFWRLKNAEKYGFTVAPMWTYTNKSDDKTNLEDMLHSLRKQANDIGLPMDGIVMAKNSHVKAESMGRTDKFFRHSIAYKFEDEVYETKLEYIDWTLGRTGILTPTAVFKPVEIDGAEVTRASMHNLSVMADLSNKNSYYKGMKLLVYKANQIIPQVKEAIGVFEDEIESEIFKTPIYCPVCGGLTEIKKDNNSEVLICANPNCTGKQLARFTHFVSKKAMNIDGLSEKTLETLLSHGFIHDFKGIYHLSDHKQQLILLDGFGEKSIDNLLKSIEDSRNVKLENFIAALGISNIGLTAAKTIASYMRGHFNLFIEYVAAEFDFTKLDDFGETMHNNIYDYMKVNFDEVEELAKEMNFIIEEKSTDNSLDGLKFCITGSFSQSRDELKKQLEDKGAKFVSSVSKNLDVLFAGDKAGSKITKAQQLGVRVANEEELMKMLEG